jgi:hypothetical protein
MRGRLQSPEFIVMGALAALCGLFLALLLSAEFGAKSSGGEAALRTTQTPPPSLAKLRQTAVRATPAPKHRAHRRVHRSRRARSRTVSTAAPTRVALTPKSNSESYAQTNQGQATPVQQLSAPSKPSPAPAPLKRQAAPKPSGGGGHHTSTSFDDSG